MHKLLGLLLLGVTVSAYASQFTTIGGAAVDDAGQPVADATVFISGKGVNSTVCGAMSVFTNSEGKWRYDRITPGIKSVRLGVWHPQFAPNHNGGSYDLTEYDDMPSLLAGTHTLTLRRGVTISGLVTDSAGRPVSGAEITYGRDSNASNALPTQFTGADGRFTLASLPDSVAYLTVKAAGFAPGQKHLYVKDRPLTVTIQLPAPLTLSGRVVNASGQPVKDANVYLDTWRGTRTLKVRLTTDADGRFTYADAPADDIKVLAYGKGYAGSEVTVSAGRDNIITLQNPTSVSGTVFDAVTNQPIPAFTIVRGLCFGDSPLISWQKHVTVSGSNGAFTVPDLTEYWGHDNTAHAFRVSADGYAPMNSSTIALDGQRHELSFALKPAADLEVQILTADGQPTSGAEAAVATIGSFFMVNDGKFDAQHGGDLLVRKSDAAGRLKIPPQDENAPWTLIVLHETGWAEITNYDLLNKSPLTVSLQRWSRVEGESRTGTRADADHELLFSKHSSGHDTAEKPWPNMRWQYNAKPDADGKFVFAQVPGGNVSVAKKIPPPNRRGWTSSYAQIFTLAAGETAPIVIGGTGRPIAGKFIIPKQFTDSGASFELARLWTIIKPENSDKMNGIFNFVPVNDDGTFNAPDIVPGDYMLQVSLMAADARVPIDPPLAMANVTVSVPPASEPASDEVFNLPPIPLQITGGKP